MRQGLAIATGGVGEDHRDAAVQRELDQHTGGAGYRLGHRVEEAARAPVQQQAQRDEHEVVGVEVGDRADQRLVGELVEQPAESQQRKQHGQQRAVFQPLARPGAALQRFRFGLCGTRKILGGARTAGGRCGQPGDQQRDQDQHGGQHNRLPQEDGFGERQHAGDLHQPRRHAGRIGLQLRSRRTQAHRPHRAQPQIGRGTSSAIIHAQLAAAGQRAHQQAAEHQREAPAEQRRQHADQADVHHCAATGARHAGEEVDEARDHRRSGQGIATDDHEGHLHGEGNQAPEAVAEGAGSGLRGGAKAHRRHRDDDHAEHREHIGIGEPFFRPGGRAQRCARHPAVLYCCRRRHHLPSQVRWPDSGRWGAGCLPPIGRRWQDARRCAPPPEHGLGRYRSTVSCRAEPTLGCASQRSARSTAMPANSAAPTQLLCRNALKHGPRSRLRQIQNSYITSSVASATPAR
ncbi:hypothetical protein D3C81_943960 [compost metagenome]